MNILFISNDPSIFKEGSAGRLRMRTYADEAAVNGGTLHILSRAAKTEEIQDGPLILHGVRTGKISMLWTLPRYARQILKAANIQVVSAQDPFELGWIAMQAVKGTSAKLHIQVHTDFLTPWFTRTHIYRSPNVRMPILNRIRIPIARRVLPKADGIRVVSQRVKNSIIKEFGTKVSVPSVIPIAVPTTVPEAVPLPPHPFTFALIAVGRLEPEKRIEDIIAAVARITDAYPALGAFIVGEGRERTKLERMVRQKGLESKIIFLGARPDARGLMRSAQAFIQTSAYEGFGLTLMEAALARVPIVTSDVGIVGELFNGYEHVLAAPVADPTNYAAHIAWLIEDHEARQELVINAERRAKEFLANTDSSPHALYVDLARLI
jgi:glycosyltransferase involved in cell wall biosynthesis